MSKIQNWLLYLFFFSLSFEIWDPFNTEGVFSIVKLVGLLYVCSVVPYLPKLLHVDSVLSRYIKPLSLFLFLLTINNIIYASAEHHTVVFMTFMFWMLFMIIIVNHIKQKQYYVSNALLFMAWGTVVQLILYKLGIGVNYNEISEMGRATIFGDNQNSVGLRIAVATMIIIYYTIIDPIAIKKIYKILLLLCVPGLLLFLIQTGSRVSLAAITLMMISSGFLIQNVKLSHRFIILLTIVIICIIGTIYIYNSPIMLTRIIASTEDGDLANRDNIWKQLMPLIEQNPVFGVGQNGYNQYCISHGLSLYGNVTSPHNVFIEILCYTGIIGLLVYLVFLGRLFYSSYKTYKKKGDYLSMLFFILILGVMTSGQIFATKLIWSIYACMIVLSMNIKTYNNNLVTKHNIRVVSVQK